MAIYQELRATEAMIPARSSLARVALAQGNAAQALALYQESLAQAQEHGQWWSVAAVLQELGRIYAAQGDFKQAAEYVWGSLNIQRNLGSQEGLVHSLEQLVEVLVFGAEQLDDLRLAARLLGAIEAFREQRPTWAGVARSEQEQIRRAIQTRLSREAFQSEWETGRTMLPEQAAIYAQAHGQ